jgi:hypothetical protein
MVHKRLRRDFKLKIFFWLEKKNIDTWWLLNVTGCIDYLLRIESAQVAASPGEGNTPIRLPVQT